MNTGIPDGTTPLLDELYARRLPDNEILSLRVSVIDATLNDNQQVTTRSLRVEPQLHAHLKDKLTRINATTLGQRTIAAYHNHYFGHSNPIVATASPDITAEQRANRELLVSAMEAAGFTNLPEEWWHHTLANEPFPETFFDAPIG